MSSARMPPSPSSPRKDSQESPRSWYGRSWPEKPAGVAIGRSRRSAWPDSRSPSQPSASTPTSGTSSSGAAQAEPGRQRVGRRHRPGLVALEELQRRLQVRVIQLDPLAAQPDQRDLQPGQFGQFVRVERLIAHRHLVPEVHQVAQAEPGHSRPGRRARRAPRPRGQLQPEPGLAHPVGQQHAEPGPGQQRPGLLEEPERARGFHLHQGRGRLAQRVLELAEQPGGRAQAGQQLLHRVAAGGHPGPEARPDVGGGDHQAGILRGLQRELDPPGIAVRGGRLGQPEAGTHRARRDHGAVPPRAEFRGQLGGLRLVLRRHHVEAGIGRGQREHEPFGHRQARRGAAAPRGQQRGGQPVPGGGVGQGIQGAAEQHSGGLPGDRPAGRGHGRGQIAGALRVRAAEHRPPPGGVRLRSRPRAPAAPGRGRPGRPRSGPPRPGRPAIRRRSRPRPATRNRPAPNHRGPRAQPPGRGRARVPASQPATPGRACAGRRSPRSSWCAWRLRADEFRRGQRPAAGRGQLQGQLVVDRLADRVPGPGLAREHVGQLGGLARERMRPWQVNVGRRAASRVGHRRQVRVLAPQAQRTVRPDPVDYPHEVLPITPAPTLTRDSDNFARTRRDRLTWALPAPASRSGRAWPLETRGLHRPWVRSCGTACSST